MAHIFIISSPSGGGKTSLTEALLKEAPGLVRSVSVTTRPMRPGEEDGKDYFFISSAEFEERRMNDEFLEWAQVFDDYYATPVSGVNQVLNNGQDVILTIDVQGARQIKEKCPEAISIFIMPPSDEELKKRLINRNTDEAIAINKRLEIAQAEIKEKSNYDHVVINDKFDIALAELKKIIKSY